MSQAATELLDDAMLMDRWEKIIKIENLQADTALKQAQSRFVPWQAYTAGATAGAALLGAGVALAHWL